MFAYRASFRGGALQAPGPMDFRFSIFDLRLLSHMLSRFMPLRIVVDTNVFIGAILSPAGENRDVLRACLLGRARPLMGAALFHEYEDLLGRSSLMSKSPLTQRERKDFFAAFLSVAEWVKVYFLWRPNLPDEADNHLVELALAGAAKSIVTHNVGDLQQGELHFPGLKIETPRQFLTTLP